MISSKYRIASIPTVMVFSKDTVKETMVGFRPKADLKKIIERHL